MDQEDTLFRGEVFERRRFRVEGEILLARPLRAQAVVALLALSVVGLGIWVIFGQYTRMEPARGIIMADNGTAKIVAIRPGIVTQMMTRDGQYVRKGQALVSVQVDQDYAVGERATQEGLSALKSQQQLTMQQVTIARERAVGEQAALAATVSGDRQQESAVEGQIAIQQQVASVQKEAMDRLTPAADRGFVSRTDMDRRRQELLLAQGEVVRLSQQLAGLRADEARSAGQLRQSQAEEHAQVVTARSSSEGFKAQASQLRGTQAYVLTAPVDGIVTALQSEVGRTVDATLPLMTIVSRNTPVHAELYAPSRAIGFVRPGQEVRLLYDAFPYERFGSFRGRVQAISRVALDPREIATPLRAEEPVYRVSVAPDRQLVSAYGEHVRLQPGMTLAANIVLERRSFIDWLLEPLRAVVNRDR